MLGFLANACNIFSPASLANGEQDNGDGDGDAGILVLLLLLLLLLLLVLISLAAVFGRMLVVFILADVDGGKGAVAECGVTFVATSSGGCSSPSIFPRLFSIVWIDVDSNLMMMMMMMISVVLIIMISNRRHPSSQPSEAYCIILLLLLCTRRKD